MNIQNNMPSLLVNQRVLTKRTTYQCYFYDGYAKVIYQSKDTAKATYDRMKQANLKVKLFKNNTLYDYWDNKTAQEIFNAYKSDIEKAMTKNGIRMKITYIIVDER